MGDPATPAPVPSFPPLPQYAVDGIRSLASALPEQAPGGLGRLPAKDPRDAQYALTRAIRALTTPAQPRKDRYWISPKPLDQGQTSTCVGHAWKHFLLGAPVQDKKAPDPFFIYREAQKIDEWPGEEPVYEGTSVRAGAKVLSRPYTHPTTGKAFTPHVAQYLWSTNLDDTIRWISEHSGMVVGTNWYSGMFACDAQGFVHPGGWLAGGHAYYILGYSLAREAFRCLNSWGAGWGQGGRFWVSFKDMERLINEDGEFCCAVEQKVVEVPTPS